MVKPKTGKDVKCESCGKLFYLPKCRLEKLKKYSCSVSCAVKGRVPWNKGVTKHDDERMMSISKKAREQMYREYANGTRDKKKIVEQAHRAVIAKSKKRFETNPNMMVGKRGYLLIYIPQKGWKKYHHYIWEKENPPVPKGFVLHHIDEDRFNNKIDNLQIITNSEHGKLHMTEERKEQSRIYNKLHPQKIDSKGRFCKK